MTIPAATLRSVSVLGVPLTVVSIETAADSVLTWARSGVSAYVCAVNVHSTMESRRDSCLRDALLSSNLNVPDGVPIVWGMRLLGAADQQRIFGPTLMWEVCVRAEQQRVPILLFGSTEETLGALQANLIEAFPALIIADAISPPFGVIAAEEDDALVSRVNSAGAPIVFVGLGAPKQEKWMLDHRDRLKVVALGVGAAFDYHSGRIQRAPVWMQRAGLEWLYRLIQEPRRLWRRYLFNNPAYLVLLGWQVVTTRLLANRSGH